MPRKGRNAFFTNKRERDLQSQCVSYAVREAYQLSKLEHKNGDTDTILTGVAIAPAVVFIEFKTERAGSNLAELQKTNKKALRKRGYVVCVIRNYEEFKNLLAHLDKHGINKKWQKPKS